MANIYTLEQIKKKNTLFFSPMALAFHKDESYELVIEDGVQVLVIKKQKGGKVRYFVDSSGFLKFKSN